MSKFSMVAKAALLAAPLLALPALKPAQAAISAPMAGVATSVTTDTPGAIQDVQYYHHRYWHRRYWHHRRCGYHGCW